MAYREPYPVTTTYPPSGIQATSGARACYHYTYTYSQVKKFLSHTQMIIARLEGIPDTDLPKVLEVGVGIGGLWSGISKAGAIEVTAATAGAAAVSAASVAIGTMSIANIVIKNSILRDMKRYRNIYQSVIDFMNKHGFKRVTFSQVLEYRVSKIAGDYLMGWYCDGYPRVPHISYYYKK